MLKKWEDVSLWDDNIQGWRIRVDAKVKHLLYNSAHRETSVSHNLQATLCGETAQCRFFLNPPGLSLSSLEIYCHVHALLKLN